MKRLTCLVLAVVVLVAGGNVALATFPGANGMIVLAARPPGEPKSLYRVDPTGENLRRLIPRGSGEDRAPAWSPDGRTLAFASSRSGDLDIWTVRLRSGDPPANLTGTTGTAELLPTWSTDGRIAFTSQEIGTTNISIDVSIASPNSPIFGIEWSPVGTRIAYSVVDAGSNDIYSIRPDGSGRRRLANDLPRAVIYDWRPDGRRILFQGVSADTFGLSEMKVGGDHRVFRLTTPKAPVTDEHATYSPNGRQVVFVRDTGSADELWVMPADGTAERRLRRLARLRAYGVSWQPL
jgi:Tol biopolymer transport system component